MGSIGMGAIECPVNGKFVSLILCTCSDPFSCSKLNLCHQFLWTCILYSMYMCTCLQILHVI